MIETSEPVSCVVCGRMREASPDACACIPAWVWRMPEMQDAVRTLDAVKIIRLLRGSVHSLTQESIGRMTGLSQSTISRIESGRLTPEETRVRRLLTDLGAPHTPDTEPTPQPRSTPPSTPAAVPAAEPELFIESQNDAVRIAQRLWAADLAAATPDCWLVTSETQLSTPLLRWLLAPPAIIEAAPHGQINVSANDVHAINRACDLFEQLDHEFGGGHARTAAVQYLSSEVAPLLHGRYTPQVGTSLFSASARFSAKVGAMAYDSGNHALGRRYFLLGLNLAHLAGDRLLGAKTLALLSHQANFLGEYRSALDFARTAKVGAQSHATPAIQAMLAAMEARALASLGDERACTAALSEMEHTFERINSDNEPTWMAYFDASELSDELAHCFHDLGKSALAIEHAQQSVRLAPTTFRRSRAFAGLIHANAHLLGPRSVAVDEACATATHVIEEAGPLRSARVKEYLARFQKRLRPYAQEPSVRDIQDRVASLPSAAH